VGELLNNVHVARAMVLSLPKTQSWDIIRIWVFNIEPDKLTIDTVSTKLQSEANHQACEKGANNTALYVQKKDARKHEKGSGKGPYVVCHDGGHSGHKAKECPHDYKNHDKAKAKSQPQSTNCTVSNLRDLGTHEIGQVFMTTGSIPDTNNILLDSAATSHMFCKRHLFSSYASSTENETISVGDKCTLVIAGQGSVTFKNQLMNGIRTVVLHGTLYVPRLTTNIISLGTLQQDGTSFRSVSNGLVVTIGDDDLFHTTLHRTLYHVNHASDTVAEVAYVVSGANLRLWHRWMGHLHLDAIRKLNQKSMVNGLTITSPKSYDHICEGCVLGKSHRLPFPNASHTHYERMELVVVDLSRPMSVTTWTGKAYMFVAVEMNSRLGIRELLESKTEASKTLKTVVVRLEQQSGKKLKCLCTDVGNKWLNKTSVGGTASYMKQLSLTHLNRTA
jgi:hypothetical protein